MYLHISKIPANHNFMYKRAYTMKHPKYLEMSMGRHFNDLGGYTMFPVFIWP